jgi:hypothetical protein
LITVLFTPLVDTFEFYSQLLTAAFNFRDRTPCFAQSKIEGEAQKIKDSTFFAIASIKSNNMRFLFIELQFVLRQSFADYVMDTFSILTVLTADNRIIGISEQFYFALAV